MKYLLFLLLVLSCKTTNQLRWQQKGTEIAYDTISIQTYKDSSGKIDTVRYMKHVYYRAKSPKTLKGHWYLVAAVVIGAAVVVLLRR
jgi:hypothetical protein